MPSPLHLRARPWIAPLILAGLVCSLQLAGALAPLDHRLDDLRFRLLRMPATGDVVLVDVDPDSLRMLGVWPWPRGYHATVLERLEEAGARAVAFDVDFSSRSADSDEDTAFAEALAASGIPVVLPVFQQWQQAGPGLLRVAELRPIPEFERVARLASINVHPDGDGRIRSYTRSQKLGDGPVPTLATALASAGDGPPFHIDFGIAAGTVPRISYFDVLAGRVADEALRDRVVIVGSTAVELGDQLTVPVEVTLPGPMVQALAYESLRQGRTLTRTPAPLTLAGVIAISLLLGGWFRSLSWRRALAWSAATAAGVLAASLVIQRGAPLLVDAAAWLAAIGGAWTVSVLRQVDVQALKLLFQRGRLRRTEALMGHVVEHSFDGILTLDAAGRLVSANCAAEVLFGRRVTECAHRQIHGRLLVCEDAAGEPLESLPTIPVPAEAVGIRDDDSRFPIELTVTAIEVDGEARQVVFVRDITERQAQQAALKHQATHDALTGLPNRYLLKETFARVLESAHQTSRPVSVLLLDLDRFKEINDVLGHPVGDLLLQRIAERLRKPLRTGDTIARLGGDEFAIVLPDTGAAVAQQVAQRLRDAVEQPFRIGDLSLQVATSVGIALFPEHGTSATELIQRADVAMYAAKRKGGGLGLYDPEQDQSSVRQLELTSALREGLETRELMLHYQPKLDAANDRTIGVEALVRWKHPELGWIRPDELVRLAEHTGLIQPLTRYVLTTALEQCASWRQRGIDLGVAVNVSARNLLEAELPQVVGELLERTATPPSRLTLEITESVLMEDPKRALDVVSELDRMGCRISIDDFGTGYSSLAYLKKLPVAELKIDQSFVFGLATDAADVAIVRSIIDMAHCLSLSVVAEGVETTAVWETLRELGCDIGQGYLFARPLPAEELELWLAGAAAASA